MTAQLSLFGAAPVATDRLFFAVFPDAQTAARLAALAQDLRAELGLKGMPLAMERFHVTLHHLGDYDGLPRDRVAQARQAGAAVSAAPFEVAFDRAGSFGRPLVLQGDDGLAGIRAFQQALGLAMAGAGLGRRVEKAFTPHVTLLYDEQIAPTRPVTSIGWIVNELVLVHSLQGKTQHIALDRWALRG